MAITYKDISQLSQKSSLAGTEKIPVSATEYITPDQIASTPVASSQPSGGMLPNVLYNLGTLTGTVSISLASGTSGIVNHYYFTFETGSTAPTINWPASITSWFGGNAPTINANKHYEVSVLGGAGVAMEV